ncbi:uncharacterized protein [Rutidosis leptorrhynchoides]|uniref:uncharacterized protein n=1 Tax=Rutidosis leptorrhynchoides TaxID=125765 RepID=UPI003A9A3554
MNDYPTIMLEAVASYDNWIWHAYFGVAGSNNDINVLNTSDLFNSMLNEEMSDVPYQINGVHYSRGYYLADGIYPTWAAFVKGFSSAVDEKRTYFTKKQASARKDVERTFGILQGRWHILQQPARAYELSPSNIYNVRGSIGATLEQEERGGYVIEKCMKAYDLIWLNICGSS